MARLVPAALIALLTLTTACDRGHGTSSAGRSQADMTPSAAQAKEIKKLAAEYLAVAKPANRRLDVEEHDYAVNAHRDLAAAEAALRAQAATERGFDQQLLEINFPPSIAATARALVLANQSRIEFTRLQAESTSIGALLTFTSGHHAVDAAVEVQVRKIRRQLGLPPPSTS